MQKRVILDELTFSSAINHVMDKDRYRLVLKELVVCPPMHLCSPQPKRLQLVPTESWPGVDIIVTKSFCLPGGGGSEGAEMTKWQLRNSFVPLLVKGKFWRRSR